jgi:hypothetical protein
VCYHCGHERYIQPKCPKLKNGDPPSTPKTSNCGLDGKTTGDGDKAHRNPLAASKKICPFDLTKAIVDEEGKEWKFCTKCKDKSTEKLGTYNLSDFYSAYVENFHAQASPEANLTRLDDQNVGAPSGPPLVTTREPTEESRNPDELVFTGMWCCPISDVMKLFTTVKNIPKANELEDDISGGSMPPLGQQREDDRTGDLEDEGNLCLD